MGFFSSKPTRCYQGVAKLTMGKVPKGYRIQVPSTHLPSPSEAELKQALEAAGFDLKGWFNNTSSAANPGNWIWSK